MEPHLIELASDKEEPDPKTCPCRIAMSASYRPYVMQLADIGKEDENVAELTETLVLTVEPKALITLLGLETEWNCQQYDSTKKPPNMPNYFVVQEQS